MFQEKPLCRADAAFPSLKHANKKSGGMFSGADQRLSEGSRAGPAMHDG